ncbi:MAG: NAD(P)H-hydrate epimerase, partial [Pyramidobacter sp.]|nr:NAD(P)H-hydrate epimerase [Pyramidobacter sp.]
MIPWYAAEKVRALDEELICSGVSGLELMERVGTGIADFIVREISPKSVLICAGAGNNGGDGFVIARLLNERNVRVTVILSHGAERSRGDAGVSLNRLLASGITVLVSAEIDDEKLAWLCAEHEIIVDALLGIGASGSPRGETARLIDVINARRCGKGVLAVDMPSGIEGDGACIQAQWTCTAAARKLPCATGRGAAVCGRIMLVPLDERAEAFLAPAEAYE